MEYLQALMRSIKLGIKEGHSHPNVDLVFVSHVLSN